MTTTFATMASIRFGYGRRPGETLPENVDALIAGVERGSRAPCLFPHEGIEGRRARFPAYRDVRLAYSKARDNNMLEVVGKRRINPYSITVANALQRDRHLKVQQAVFSPNAFFERLSTFWSDHFSINILKSSAVRILAAMHEAEAIRPNLAGRFADLVKASALHPAMLDYLDQTRSVGPTSPVGLKAGRGVNENLARELIELHTMGAGSGYSQQDVREAAFVLTGLWFRSPAFKTEFRPKASETGVYRVLGRTYGGRSRNIRQVHALIDDLAAREETRRHICRKLVVHFISDDPPQPVVDAMVEAWQRHDGELLAVYRAMLEHPRSWEEEGRKARQPFDFVVAALRALNVPADALEPTTRDKKVGWRPAWDGAALEDVSMMAADGKAALGVNPFSVGILGMLGQQIWEAPSPAGWEEGLSTWITASQLTERIAWARRLVARFGGSADPRAFLQTTMADAARADTIETVARAPNRTVAMAMVLASPEFNKR